MNTQLDANENVVEIYRRAKPRGPDMLQIYAMGSPYSVDEICTRGATYERYPANAQTHTEAETATQAEAENSEA